MAWVTDHRPDGEALNACVTCGLCLPVCPTFRITGDETASPRGRLRAMIAVEDGEAPVDARFADVMSLCLQCRACETACPSLVPFGSVMESSRAEVVSQVAGERGRFRRFLTVTVLRSRLLLRLATRVAAVLQRLGVLTRVPRIGNQAEGLRRLPLASTSAVGGSWGPADGQVAMLLTGCVSDVWFSDLHRATIELLVAAGYRVEAPSSQTCCGALASHGGFAGDAAAMATANIEAFADADLVVADVAGCGAHLKTYTGSGGADVAAKTKDITSVVAEAIEDGRLPVLPHTGQPVGIQDPCHMEHGLRTHTAADAVVEAAGHVPIPIDRGGLCCGAAGMYQIEHPDISEHLGIQKAAAATEKDTTIIVSANAGCEMQLRRYLSGASTVMHPVELYASQLKHYNG